MDEEKVEKNSSPRDLKESPAQTVLKRREALKRMAYAAAGVVPILLESCGRNVTSTSPVQHYRVVRTYSAYNNYSSYSSYNSYASYNSYNSYANYTSYSSYSNYSVYYHAYDNYSNYYYNYYVVSW